MQKLPEARDRKRGDACERKGAVPTKERISFFFSSDQWSDKTKIFLTSGGRRHVSVSRRRVGKPFHY